MRDESWLWRNFSDLFSYWIGHDYVIVLNQNLQTDTIYNIKKNWREIVKITKLKVVWTEQRFVEMDWCGFGLENFHLFRINHYCFFRTLWVLFNANNLKLWICGISTIKSCFWMFHHACNNNPVYMCANSQQHEDFSFASSFLRPLKVGRLRVNLLFCQDLHLCM